MEWVSQNWTTVLSIGISVIALTLSLLSFLNSKRMRVLSNQPMLEINHIFEDSLVRKGYLTISLHNLNDKPIQITGIEFPGERFKFETDHGGFSVTSKPGESNVPKRNSLLLYVYMDKKQTLNKELILTYRDLENKRRKLKSEKIILQEGKLKRSLNGSKFIMK